MKSQILLLKRQSVQRVHSEECLNDLIKKAIRSSKLFFQVLFFLFVSIMFSQDIVFPPEGISCTSKDLELVGAALPPPNNNPCACDGTRTLELSINNKTGSFRTAFSFWGYLHRYDSNGIEISVEAIFACTLEGVPPNSITKLNTGTTIDVYCDQSIKITDLTLAWTSASLNQTCEALFNNPDKINPKCGTLPEIIVETGVNGVLAVTDATCTSGGSIQMSPFGGVPPYSVQIDGQTGITVNSGGSTTFSALTAGSHTVTITDSNTPSGCTNSFNRTINAAVVPSALVLTGSSICSSNPNTGGISSSGSETGVSYQLYDGSNVAVQSPQNGTGSGLSWSNLPSGNGYYAVGTGGNSNELYFSK